jgi:hypothetical protein
MRMQPSETSLKTGHYREKREEGRATECKKAEEKREKGLDTASYKLYYVN